MILLDTQSLVWLMGNKKKLSIKAFRSIEQAINRKEIIVSSISIWEISLLVKKGRLKLAMDLESWIERIENLNFLQFIPVDNNIAVKSIFLPEPFQRDPADRIIIATALTLAATVITSDRRILKYPYVKSIW